ncbi:Hypothetical protein SAMN05421734_11310 [Pelagirhabdus alkalitolerans]|uniref:DUF2513 domain-containing protein n=1 Tax=Pelagirhabdus alkalitolerans TaxID=1612202 RepID=A0A1G6MYL3_9BACI|nr:DUF2513 domain-containing protein [Pelagirhabdus alkalitolerans]SDC60541.1 Hypothetical protein SAMN05421734_11310 [Pelagirhabdus alkalitolerans]
MKRDMELIRSLLLEIEEDERDRIIFNPDDSDKYTSKQIQYNLKLMVECGLIKGSVDNYWDGYKVVVSDLTWEGHDFLDAARNDTIWNEAKEIAKQKGSHLSDLPIAVVTGILVSVSKQIFGI